MARSRETSNEIAFALDPERVEASGDGMTVPPLPGLYRNDVAVHPSAVGLTLREMRDLVEELSLPLVEVRVSEGSALREFVPPDGRVASEPGWVAYARSRGAAAETTEGDEPEAIVGDPAVALQHEELVTGETEEDG